MVFVPELVEWMRNGGEEQYDPAPAPDCRSADTGDGAPTGPRGWTGCRPARLPEGQPGAASGSCAGVAQLRNVDACQVLIGFEHAPGEMRSVLLERERDRVMPEEPL
jgi:hypothetical protein